MGVTFGGGVLFVVAAVIIAAIIVPRVVRRREESETLKHQERLERAIAALAATEHEIADARVVESARDAVTREKVMQQQRKREAAERRARIARAKAEVAEARLKARQAELERRAKLRAARLQTVFVRRLRGLAALGFLLAVLGVLVGLGVVIAGNGATVLLFSALSAVITMGVLILLAPGKTAVPRQVTVSVPPRQQVVDPPAVATQAEPVATETSMERHRRAQAAAAARIARAKAIAATRSRVTAAAANSGARENLPGSILLQSPEQSRASRAQQRSAAQTQSGSGAQTQNSPVVADQQRSVVRTQQGVSARAVPQLRAVSQRPEEAAAVAAVAQLQADGILQNLPDSGVDIESALRLRRKNA